MLIGGQTLGVYMTEEKEKLNDADAARFRKLELESEIEIAKAKKAEAEAGVKKVIYGTMIVGISAAAFPFLSSYAEQMTARNATQLEISLAEQKIRIDDAIASRTYLESLATEARSEDLQTRLVLADFYRHLAPTLDERERWAAFQADLVRKQDEITAQRVANANIPDSELTSAEAIESRLKLEAFERYEAPQPEYREFYVGRGFSEDILKLQYIASSKGCRIRPDGLLGIETVECVASVSPLDLDEAVQILSFYEGPSLLGSMLLDGDTVSSADLLAYLEENGRRRDPNSEYFTFLRRFYPL